MRICVIDDLVSVNLVESMLNCNLANSIYIINEGQYKEKNFSISHGTLCTALLVETLKKYNCENLVEIIFYSIVDEKGNKSYANLLKALQYCVSQDFELVSLSMGVLGINGAKEIQVILENLKSTLVICAASNNGLLTYPAALTETIGVKRSLSKDRKMIEWVENPADGIELIVNFSETQLLQLLLEKYGYIIKDSNSILVPQICGKLAMHALKSKKLLTKKNVCTYLGASLRRRDIDDYKLPLGITIDTIPVIIFPYDCNNKEFACDFAVSLQSKFENEGYICSLLSDLFDEMNFVLGRYVIDMDNPHECISYLSGVSPFDIFVCTVYGIYAAYYGDGGTIHNAWHNRTATALLCDNKRVGKLLRANGLYGRPICRGHFARRIGFSGGRVRNESGDATVFSGGAAGACAFGEFFRAIYGGGIHGVGRACRIRRGAGARGSRALHAGDGR